MKRGAAAILLLASSLGAACGARAETGLQPVQMVRSLQQVQDRIADGDHASLPMQKKLLEMIDARLRGASAEELGEEANLRAVLIYGMSGGNPATVESSLAALDLKGDSRALALGVVNYLRGQPAAAQKALGGIDPMALRPELGAFVALVKGSLVSAADPAAALALLDRARLLGPGTLVEEAALRRSISLAVATGDGGRFLRAASQYVRRFLRSPYASQFADAFVAGAVELDGKFAREQLEPIAARMTAEQRQVVYLRIARRAAVDGRTDLVVFASGRAAPGPQTAPADDPRAMLYAALGTFTAGTSEEALAAVGSIDRSRLTRSDVELLEAMEAAARGLTADPPSLDAVSDPPAATDAPDDPAPLAGAVPAGGPVETDPAPTAVPNASVAADAEAPASPEADAADASIANARQRLEAIDELLEAGL